MLWAVLAVLATLLWTFEDVIDKFIITRELRDPISATAISGVSTFLLFSIVSFSVGNVLLPLITIIIAVIGGILFSVATWLYYSALSKEEVSRVIPVITTIPIFVSFLAFIFLGETFTLLTYVGIGLVVLGAILVSIKKITYKVKISSAFFIAVVSAIFFALRSIAIKSATLQASIWPLLFWIGLGIGIVSGLLFLFHHPHIRRKAEEGVKHLLLIGGVNAVAFFIFISAVSIGPVSLVSALVSVQPLFVFLAAIMLSKFYPEILKEKFTKPIILQKLVAIVMVVIGAVLVI